MSFPRYPEYKESNVEWLGKVPNHWDVISIRRLSPVQRGASPRPIDDPKFFDESGEYSWVRIADVSASNGFLENTPQKLSDLGSSLSVKLEPNNLFVSIAGTVGKPCITKVKACIHDGFVYFPALKINHNWLYRIFEAGVCYGGLGKMGTQLNLNTDTIGSIKVAAPPVAEINQLLAFMDHETAKIDNLVAEQEKLIELLREKGQAVISQAVTKGLNPKVKMKSSGVAWLGEIPEHWGVRAIKHIVSTPVTDGPHETPEFLDEGVPFVSAEAVSSGEIDFSKIRGYISEECHKRYSLKYLPKRGDIFVIKSGATTGVTAIVETDQEFNIWSPLAVIRCNAESNPYYVLNFMRSLNFQEAVALNWNFGTQQNIGMGVIENLFCPVPSQQEQKAIAEYLTSFTKQFNTLISEANNAIELLKERRSALISAAVTGQIDVRNYQPKEAA